MTIKDQQLIGANALISMLNKVPQPLNTKLISYLSILTQCDSLVLRYIITLIPRREVVLARKDNKRQNRPSICVDSLDCCSLLTITWLDCLPSSTPLRASNNQLRGYLAYQKPSLIKVVGILINNAVRSLNTLHKVELLANYLIVLAESSLSIVRSIESRCKGRTPFDKVPWPVSADLASATRSEQLVGYISYSVQCRREPSRIQVQYISNNYLFLQLRELL